VNVRGTVAPSLPSPAHGEGVGRGLEAAVREGRRGRAASRREVFLWAAAILFLNQLFVLVKEFPAVSLETLGTIGIFQYMAWYVIFRLLGSSDPMPAARPQDFLATGALCLAVFARTNSMVWVAATGIAIYLWFLSAGDRKLRAAGTVLAALATQELWGHLFFDLVAVQLLSAEAAVVGTLLEIARPGTVWQDNIITEPNGYGVLILPPCSSFHNLSLAMLCWVTISMLRRQDWQARDFVIGAAIGGTMILLNIARICLMAWNIDLYYYWHDGTGAEIYAIGATLTVLLMSLYGSKPARRLA
jgi:exosortase/archaeosortase family protein